MNPDRNSVYHHHEYWREERNHRKLNSVSLTLPILLLSKPESNWQRKIGSSLVTEVQHQYSGISMPAGSKTSKSGCYPFCRAKSRELGQFCHSASSTRNLGWTATTQNKQFQKDKPDGQAWWKLEMDSDAASAKPNMRWKLEMDSDAASNKPNLPPVPRAISPRYWYWTATIKCVSLHGTKGQNNQMC